MKFQSIIFTIFATLASSEKCPTPSDNCGDVSLPPNNDISLDVSFYSGINSTGDTKKSTIKGIYGCTNDVPDFQIKSMTSTGSTQLTLHYGKDCIGHVIDQVQGGSFDLDSKKGCPGSVFIKLNRYGSC